MAKNEDPVHGRKRAGTFNMAEVAKVVEFLREGNAPQEVIDLVMLIGGQAPRDGEALQHAVDAVCRLSGDAQYESKRDVDSVKPHPSSLDTPAAPRGSVRAKRTELDAPLKERKKGKGSK